VFKRRRSWLEGERGSDHEREEEILLCSHQKLKIRIMKKSEYDKITDMFILSNSIGTPNNVI